ncbi:MAG: UDP-glucose--hexose-1-phosphate uridylyltransferase [Pacificimonas sp.]|jgi:UDPglucose--hexose-1-phosphate uridylyltransferase|nr:UDP-glucose--hexose-1-phosphate uridylyltransferase [Pacificimonas sp.]
MMVETGPHRRYNPLTDEWLLVSPQRAQRPWQGAEAKPDEQPRPAYDEGCYLCPGNLRAGGVQNPDYTGVFVFENDFSALSSGGNHAPLSSSPLFQNVPARGTCRVICFSPDHSRTLPELSAPQRRAVVDTWADQTLDLGQRHAWVQLFENKGEMMGCSNPHPHGQVWATDYLPNEAVREDRTQAAYLAQHGTNMLLDVAAAEAASGERVVASTADWLAVVPYWAAWPFETLLLPRFALQRLPDMTPGQRDGLAAILGELTARYDNLFGTRFPYSMGWHQAPFGDRETQHWQVHAHFYPPLLRSATVRKFMVGYEMLAEPQRDLTPEQAAERLRAVPGALSS